MPETILIVEDDERVRTLTSIVLRNAGFHVLEARDGPEAIDVAKRARDSLRLVIIDAVLPSMAGQDVAARVLAERPDIRVLYVSGYSWESMPAGRTLEPQHDFLEKPFMPTQLLRKVRAALR